MKPGLEQDKRTFPTMPPRLTSPDYISPHVCLGYESNSLNTCGTAKLLKLPFNVGIVWLC